MLSAPPRTPHGKSCLKRAVASNEKSCLAARPSINSLSLISLFTPWEKGVKGGMGVLRGSLHRREVGKIQETTVHFLVTSGVAC